MLQGILPTTRKDILPIQMRSNIVYKFACHCDKWYIGKTSQRLTSRIKEHVPKCVRTAAENSNIGPAANPKLALAQPSLCKQQKFDYKLRLF